MTIADDNMTHTKRDLVVTRVFDAAKEQRGHYLSLKKVAEAGQDQEGVRS